MKEELTISTAGPPVATAVVAGVHLAHWWLASRQGSVLAAAGAGLAIAAREGARAAVKDAILEILSNPEHHALIAPVAAPPSPPVAPTREPKPVRPSFWTKLKAKVVDAKAAVVLAIVPSVVAVTGRCRTAVTTITTTARLLTCLMPVRRVVHERNK